MKRCVFYFLALLVALWVAMATGAFVPAGAEGYRATPEAALNANGDQELIALEAVVKKEKNRH